MKTVMKHTPKEWVATTRYWSFSVSAMPVVVTVAYLCSSLGAEAVSWLNAVAMVVAVVLFHAAGNLLSDVGDYRSGADSEEAYAVPTLVRHLFEPREYVRLAVALATVAALLGLWMAWQRGWMLLAIGVTGVLLTVCYTKSKNVYLSDVLVFLVFGVLTIMGTDVAVTGQFHAGVLQLSLPLGMITLSVLHINNTVDIATDSAVGIRTVAMALGERRSVVLYRFYQLLPYLLVTLSVALGWMAWPALLCWLSLPVAWGNVRQSMLYGKEGREALLGLDQRSAKLQLVFSLLFAVGLFLSLAI